MCWQFGFTCFFHMYRCRAHSLSVFPFAIALAHTHTPSLSHSGAHTHTPTPTHTHIHTLIRSCNRSLPHKRPGSTRERQSGGAPQTEPAISAPIYTQIYKYHVVSTYVRMVRTYTPRVSYCLPLIYAHTYIQMHIHDSGREEREIGRNK